MSDAKYVYREVSGRELEKATADGWEFVTSSTPFGPFGFYLVRRPFEMPEAMKLTADLNAAREALERSQQAREVLSDRLTRAKDAVKAHAATAARTGRDKPTRDDLVGMAYRLERDFPA
jgi:hypothetical protein